MKEVERQKIWEKYTKNPTQEMREQIIIEYAPLVKIVAGRLSMYLGGNVEYEDLVSYGVFGLIDAIDKFDTNKDVKFETYASLRIRGSILDQIRKMDWIPRTVRQRQRKIDEAIKSLEARTGKTPTDEMLAEELGADVEIESQSADTRSAVAARAAGANKRVEVGTPQVKADLDTKLRHFDGNENGVHLGLEVTVPITFHVARYADFTITVKATFEQEVRVAINVDGEAVWKVWGIFPYIADQCRTNRLFS